MYQRCDLEYTYNRDRWGEQTLQETVLEVFPLGESRRKLNSNEFINTLDTVNSNEDCVYVCVESKKRWYATTITITFYG